MKRGGGNTRACSKSLQSFINPSNRQFKLSYGLLVLALIILSVLLVPGQASGFGVSAPYFEDDLVKLEAGQAYDYVVIVQNPDEIQFEVDFIYEADPEIARLVPRDFIIPATSYDNQFVFQLTAPKSADLGKEYAVSYKVVPKVDSEDQIPFTVELSRSFTVLIVDSNGVGKKPRGAIAKFVYGAIQSNVSKAILIVMIIIILAGALFYLGRRFWKFSIHASGKIEESASRIFRFKRNRIISKAESLDELLRIIRLVPEEQIMLPEIKRMVSLKLQELNENKLSDMVSGTGRKENLIMLIQKKIKDKKFPKS